MNSLQLYRSVYSNVNLQCGLNRLKKVDEIVQCIIEEIMIEPYDLNKSSLIKEAMRLIENINMDNGMLGSQTGLYSYDIYVIMKALREKINDANFTVTESTHFQNCEKNLFKKKKFGGNQQEKMNEINRILKDIQKIVDEKKRKIILNTRKKKKIYNISSSQLIGRTKINESTRELDDGTQGRSVGGELSKKNYGVFQTEKLLERSNNCKINIQRWHDENQAILRKLNEMQPSISEILQKMMQFSNEITENYVLQFAKMQIGLFNLIADNLQYHMSVVNKSNNQDYYNAVANYQEFMDMIIDNLSAFGIEEISSVVGSKFDGNLHEVRDSNDFSPRLSSIKESVRTGFKYKDLVIQKERVRV